MLLPIVGFVCVGMWRDWAWLCCAGNFLLTCMYDYFHRRHGERSVRATIFTRAKAKRRCCRACFGGFWHRKCSKDVYWKDLYWQLQKSKHNGAVKVVACRTIGIGRRSSPSRRGCGLVCVICVRSGSGTRRASVYRHLKIPYATCCCC